jgi:hypothetical protein
LNQRYAMAAGVACVEPRAKDQNGVVFQKVLVAGRVDSNKRC